MSAKPPSNQKYLNVSFALDDGAGDVTLFHLPIRPEELTRAEPSRVSVVNSLDGAWVDDFGRGLTSLTISGNTGWRIRDVTSGLDGIGSFMRLRDDFIHKWHEARAARRKKGVDPDGVRLIFIDPINGDYVADVVPTNFTLRRSKSQPLLMLYNIALTVTNDRAYNPFPQELYAPNDPVALSDSLGESLSLLDKLQAGLGGALSAISSFAAQAKEWTAQVFGPVMALANKVIQTANMAKGVISAAGQIVVNLAADLSAVGMKIWAAVAAVTSLPLALRAQVMQIKGAFSNVHCVLVNGYSVNYESAMDYSDLYGASNCSSTLGGRPASPLRGINPFAIEAEPARVIVSPTGAQAISDIKRIDIVSQLNAGLIASSTSDMSKGIVCPA